MKKTKKFLSIALVVILLLSMIPLSIFEIEASSDIETTTVIKNVAITIDDPTVGAAPATGASVSGVPGLSTVGEGDIHWSVMERNDDDIDFVSLNDGEKFEIGKYYSVDILIDVPENYTISKNLVATINGKRVYCEFVGNAIDVHYDYNKLSDAEPTYIDAIDITIAEPMIGANPWDTEATVVNTNPSFEAIVSYDSWAFNEVSNEDLDENWKDNWDDENMSQLNFEANKYYGVTVSVLIPDGFDIDENSKATINGNDAILVQYQNHAEITYVFDKLITDTGEEPGAKKPAELKTNIEDLEFVVGVPQEFTFSTVANDDAGVMVIGSSNFSVPDAIEKLEYYEVNDGNWYELTGDFGPSTGFPMSNATSKFRVTFAKAGNYTFTSVMKKAGTDKVLCEVEATAVVRDFVPGKLTTNIDDLEFTVGVPQEFTFSTIANDDDNIMVIGSINFNDSDAIRKLEYYEVKDGNWYELKGDFGPSNGFPMTDSTSRFRVTFAKAGEFTFTASMKNVETNKTLCSTEATAKVAAYTASEMTTNLETVEFVVGEAKEFTLTTVANSDANKLAFSKYSFDDFTAVEKLEYFSFDDSSWHEIKKNGPISAKPLADNITKLRVTFAKTGNHTFTATMTSATDNVICSVTATATVTDAPEEPPKDIVVENVDVTITAPVIDGIPALHPSTITIDKATIKVDDTILEWYMNAQTNNLEDENWEKCTENFIVNNYHSVIVEFELPEGYTAAEEITAKVNGKKAIVITKENLIRVVFVFDKLTDAKEYEITDGKNAEWKDNSKEGLIFRSTAEFKDFVGVKIDGKDVDSKDYEASEGSTIVKFKANFLKSLDAGKHTITIVSENGEASTEFTVVHEHAIKKVEEKKATCTEKGLKEHYVCECGKLFSDAEAKNEVVDKTSLEINETGHKAATEWSRDSKNHWHKCTECGEKLDVKAHDFDKTGKICQTCKYDVDNPQTGDSSNIVLMVVFMILSVVGMGAVVGINIYNKKRNLS